MKIGYILECGPDGADMKVMKHLTELIAPGTEFDYEPLDVKPRLVKECGKAAKRLIGSGCDKVFIVWDLYPAWREKGEKPCRKEDKDAIRASLQANEVTTDDVIFLCIEYELESWLVADGRVLNSYFSKPHRVIDSIKDERNPDRVNDPKGKLTKYFKEFRGGRYEDWIHAEQLIKRIENFQKLKKSTSFCRLYEKITGNALKT